jgi:opacity protein-like surface antigen
MIIAALSAAAFMAAADAPAAAQPPSVTAQSAAAAGAAKLATSNPDQMVCVKTEQTGSRFPKTECRTRAQWRQLTQDSKDLLDDVTTKHQMASPLNAG